MWLWYRSYRQIMTIAHRYHWHYAPPVYPEGDTLLWCQWCGLKHIVRRRGQVDALKKPEVPQ